MTPIADIKANKSLRYSRRLNFVPRWAVVPTIRKQSVAEHSYNVAMTVVWLMHFAPPTAASFELSLIIDALGHDNDEALTGDRPGPDKAFVDPRHAPVSRVVVKVADYLEAIAFISEETLMGNRFGMRAILSDNARKLGEYWAYFPWDLSRGEKPNVDTIIELYLAQCVPTVHPTMEERDGS